VKFQKKKKEKGEDIPTELGHSCYRRIHTPAGFQLDSLIFLPYKAFSGLIVRRIMYQY